MFRRLTYNVSNRARNDMNLIMNINDVSVPLVVISGVGSVSGSMAGREGKREGDER